MRSCTSCDMGVHTQGVRTPTEGEGSWHSLSTVSLLLSATNSAPAGKPPSCLAMPIVAKKEGNAPRWAPQGGETRADNQPDPNTPWGQETPAKQVGEPELAWLPAPPRARQQTPAACPLTPFTSRQGTLHNQLCPQLALRNLGSLHPSRHSRPPRLANTGSGSWGGTRQRLKRGSGHSSSTGSHTLSAQPWLEPGEGAALAGLGGSAAGRVAPGLGCWGSRIPAVRAGFPCSLISPSKLGSPVAPASLPPWGSKQLRVPNAPNPRHRLPQPRASRRKTR